MSRRFQISNFEKQRALFRKLKLRGVELLLRQMKRGDKLPLSDQTWAGPKLLKLGLKQPHLFNPRQKALPYTVGMHTTFTVGRERERERGVARGGWSWDFKRSTSVSSLSFRIYVYIIRLRESCVDLTYLWSCVWTSILYFPPPPSFRWTRWMAHTREFMDHIQNRRFYF